MAWTYLLIAGMLEWGWPIGLKFAWTDGGIRWWPAAGALACMIASGAFLLLAQRTIPMGTAYAVWTGIGAAGTFILGLIFLGEPATAVRFVCVGLIIAGVVGLKLAAPE